MRRKVPTRTADDGTASAVPLILRTVLGSEAQTGYTGSFDINAGCSVATYSTTGHDLPAAGTGHIRLLALGEDAGHVIQVLLILTDGVENDRNRNCVLLSFKPGFTALYTATDIAAHQLFRSDAGSLHAFSITAFLRGHIADLQAPTVADDALLRALSNTTAAVAILRGAMESATAAFGPCAVPACRFLAFDSEREKIVRAREILDAHFEEGVSIKDLARRVAMNECYLKKGFKMLVGSTVHEYQSNLRIEAARRMLGNGSPVTEVAATLGYSSISHFSTAFKKATGLKPCELLVIQP